MAVEMRYKAYVAEGFDIVKANLVPSVVLGLLMGVPLVGGIFIVNYMAAVKKAKHEGREIQIGDLFDFDNAVDKVLGPLIVGVALGLFLIPGALILFAPCLAADRPGPFMGAVKGSLAFGKANAIPMVVLTVVFTIIIFAAILLCVLPVLIVAPTVCAAAFVAYEDHKAALEAAAAEDGVQI